VTTPDPLPRLLQPLARQPGRSALLVDFDGSLAPIVLDPAAARPDPGTRAALARLVGRVGIVAVVSGRPVRFLEAVMGLPGIILAGQYGLEQLDGGIFTVDQRAQAFAPAVAAAAAEAEAALPDLFVERKGALSVTLHWRRHPELEEAACSLGADLAARHGLAVQPGRMALELRPPLAVDKGTATETLVRGAQAALFAGDDAGDVAAFTALDRLVAAGRLGAALRVAVRSPEAPPELLERADYQVDGPAGLAGLLDRLAAVLD
jgi:trehalose 6-phosphate phosphatase